MFNIHCPYCEEYRSEEEFHASGEAHIERPKDPESCTEEEWGNYLFFRKNPRGIHHELWHHSIGCRKFFNITRNTQTYEILETYKSGEQPTITSETVKKSNSKSKVTATSKTVSKHTKKPSTKTASKKQAGEK